MTKSASRLFRPGWLFLTALMPFLVTGTVAHAQSSCQDQCLANYDSCSQNCLGGNFYGCDETCQNTLDSCLTVCPACPTTRTYTQLSILSTQLNPFQEGCFNTRSNNTLPKAFDHYTILTRKQTFQETTACNGTKSTVLIGDTTSSSNCWDRPFFDRACKLGATPGRFGSATPECPF